MTFRKDSLLFYQSEIFYIVMAILSLTLLPILGLESFIFYLYIAPVIILCFVNPKLHDEFITINEAGISCKKFGKEVWSYEWGNIKELKRSSRYLMPSIEVVTHNAERGKAERYTASNHYFQLGKTAKDAIKRYYISTGHH